MNDQQRMLADMVDGVFASLGPNASVAQDWQAIANLAIPSLLVPEDAGGFGGTWQDAAIVFRLAGYHALSLPVAEAAIASHLAVGLGLEGRGTIAERTDGVIAQSAFTGRVLGAVMSVNAAFIAAPAPGGGTMLIATPQGQCMPGTNPAEEARDVWHFEGVSVQIVPQDVFQLGSFAQVAKIAGALDAALALSVGYVNERQQFGRALGKFQAVQQSLASFACEAAAANCALTGFASALDRGDASYEAAAAKLRANRAVGQGTAIAHQVHGAIGFTREYHLHPFTRRLWSARSEFGGDSFWAAELGGRIAAAGADRYWSDLTALDA